MYMPGMSQGPAYKDICSLHIKISMITSAFSPSTVGGRKVYLGIYGSVILVTKIIMTFRFSESPYSQESKLGNYRASSSGLFMHMHRYAHLYTHMYTMHTTHILSTLHRERQKYADKHVHACAHTYKHTQTIQTTNKQTENPRLKIGSK